MTATDHPVISPKKLIEVALPLDAINTACAREKSIRHGHPSTLHLWWARRPLAAARAVIFGQLVHDPEDLWRTQNPGVEPKPQNKSAWTRERGRLFKIIEDLVLWENTTNEEVLEAARVEIRRSWKITCELNKDHPQAAELFNPDKMPGLHDPFAGGGAIPLEAQRLGLEAYASDLNPVAVLINKAMIEIPPKFAGRPPVHPDTRADASLKQWEGASGLAEDVRRYGQWMRDEAEKRIGHLYPKIKVSAEMAKDRPDLKDYVGQELNVIAWLWSRTVKSPNPAFSHVDVPLASSFILSSKKGKEAYVHPVVRHDQYDFVVRMGKPTAEIASGTKASRGANFRCLLSQYPIDGSYVKMRAAEGKLSERLLAIVAEGKNGRLYLSPNAHHSEIAKRCKAPSRPDTPLPESALGFSVQLYFRNGTFADLFTERQLAALSVYSDLLSEARQKIREDADSIFSSASNSLPLSAGGNGAAAYADTVVVYLALALDKVADYNSAMVMWSPSRDQAKTTFARNAMPMVWDFAEVNMFAKAAGDYIVSLQGAVRAIERALAGPPGCAIQASAQSQTLSRGKVISTDPPYFDNIGYADLSDFFYAWLRLSLRTVFPTIFATVSVPKAEELVATPSRHGGRSGAREFFMFGMEATVRAIGEQQHAAFPMTVYYAFKQSDTKSGSTSSDGWEMFLEAVVRSGFAITGTWPIRTEREVRSRGIGSNALASSVVLVCRRRSHIAEVISRRQFIRMLNETLPLALDAMTRESEGMHSPVAPVDLSQAIIGPGMAIFSRYEAVLEADGTPMSVKTALQLINRFLAEDDFDADTQFCLHWFEQHGWDTGKFGEADTLARAKGTSVEGVKHAGVVEAGGGSVRLLRWKEYPTAWDPRSDNRLPVWEALHHMIRVYQSEGDSGAAHVLAAVASKAEACRQLAYRLYTLCERKGWAEDARAYNGVVTGWSAIERNAAKVAKPEEQSLFDFEEASS